MRLLVLLAALAVAPAALAQSSPAASQLRMNKAAVPPPRGAASPCTDANGSYVGCGYNSGNTAAQNQFRSSTARLANGGQPVDSGTTPVGSTARCNDGSYSSSVLGACAKAGGVAEWLRPPQ
jgi:hypothetical protein